MKFKEEKMNPNYKLKHNLIENKRNSTRMATKISILKQFTLCIVALQFTSSIILQTNAYNNYQPGSPYYDPENQVGTMSPSIQWRYDDHQDEDSKNMPVSRRVSDTDLDDGLEEEDDEDRDDYAKSGSTNHGRYVEDPAFGESDRAARDGENIEGFFDKHLGPQAAMEAENNSDDDQEVPISGLGSRAGPVDHYEAAASSPLSNIFHSLLNAHKRPFIIHTTEEDPSSSSSSPNGNSNDSQQSTSSSAPVGSSVRGTPQVGTYVNTATMQGASGGGGYAAPIAYYTPVAAPSSVASYDQSEAGAGQDGGPAQENGNSGNSGQEEYAPVREIYISRRPSVMNHYQAYAPPSQGLEHQSSNAYWRGSAATTGRGPYGEDQGDYARYPVAASYAYQREQQSALPEEEQTVSFGLSFGRAPSENADDDNQENQSSVDEAGSEPGYVSRDAMLRHSPSMRSYNNYNYPPMVAHGYTRAPQGAAIVTQHHHQQQQQYPYHGARYHKDPSESSAQPINYGQYSGSSSALTPVAKDNRWVSRQQLLANLDRQIKNSPQYQRQGSVLSPVQQSAMIPPTNQGYNARQKANSNGLDTFRSYNSEVDPFKSFTTTSRILTEPTNRNSNNNNSQGIIRNNQMQIDNNRLQATNNDDKNSINRANNLFEVNRTVENKNTAQVQTGTTDGNSAKSQYAAGNLLTGPIGVDNSQQQIPTSTGTAGEPDGAMKINRRVRREDSDDREGEDPDDDGVWVDDDEDEDNKQQSSDLNETSQQPEAEEEAQHDIALHTPGVARGMHGYEISPDNSLVLYN